jgi:HK97 family phage portal protein
MEQRAEWGSAHIIPPPGSAWGGGYDSAAADLRRFETALQQVAVWSSIDLIASVAAQLPIDTYAGTAIVRSPRTVLDPGGDGYGAPDWIYQYLVSKLARGNTYGRPYMDDRGDMYVPLLYPDDVHGWRDRQTGRVKWRVDGRGLGDGETMWHRRSYVMPGRLLGLSPIAYHATTIGQGLSAARFGMAWFADGAHPSAVLTNTEAEIGQTQAEGVKARFLAAIHGRREPLVLGKGWDWKALQVAPDESQFLETQKFSAADSARIYGPNVAEILGYETGGSMTYANVEQRSIDFLKFTLNRWLRDVEAALSSLIKPAWTVRFNRGALLETDLLTRYRAHSIGIGANFLTPDEARELEDRPPLTPEQKADLAAITVKDQAKLNAGT